MEYLQRQSKLEKKSGNFNFTDEELHKKKTNNTNMKKAYEDHNNYFDFLKPFLETLPFKPLHNPSKDMMSLVLSMAA